MGRALADKAVLFLQSHGFILTGLTVGQAFEDLYDLGDAYFPTAIAPR